LIKIIHFKRHNDNVMFVVYNNLKLFGKNGRSERDNFWEKRVVIKYLKTLRKTDRRKNVRDKYIWWSQNVSLVRRVKIYHHIWMKSCFLHSRSLELNDGDRIHYSVCLYSKKTRNSSIKHYVYGRLKSINDYCMAC